MTSARPFAKFLPGIRIRTWVMDSIPLYDHARERTSLRMDRRVEVHAPNCPFAIRPQPLISHSSITTSCVSWPSTIPWIFGRWQRQPAQDNIRSIHFNAMVDLVRSVQRHCGSAGGRRIKNVSVRGARLVYGQSLAHRSFHFNGPYNRKFLAPGGPLHHGRRASGGKTQAHFVRRIALNCTMLPRYSPLRLSNQRGIASRHSSLPTWR